ncbi:efflux RND transporter periplasmic adaptor subunit [Methylotenera mobilis]|jgi:membrane fusion protein, heavy metal efflux system|uniref:efflux RND transporter periplasmic adaptor subunit n=1 Tax=Methylotenera mobilis TaxID=359408 RepID=UPI000365F993|nr:efflux RND transporter periplasmic adaptor subunit [Methylotenera mobilis]PPC97068.1 MAG: efflux RND transporter periplasmic adaptor subunit [Methylotenera sp.]
MNYFLSLISMFVIFIGNVNAADVLMSLAQQKSLGVVVAPVGKNNLLSSRRFPAEIVIPVGQERIVSAPQSGLLDQMHVAAGQTVKKGQVIAHLISPDLLGLQRDYLQALTQKRLATKALARDTELLKDGIIAQRRHLETESAHDEASANLAQRKQALKLAGMSDGAISKLSPSAGMMSGLSLVAPISGQVLEQMVTTGQRVDMAMPIYRIAKMSPLWLEIHAPLEGLPFVKEGMQVQVPKLQASGHLIAVIRSVNKADQTLHLRAEITKGAEKLSPGQFVEAEINLGGQSQYFSVPKSALARQGASALVFAQTQAGFKPIKVTIISEQGDDAVVDAPFVGTEKIAVSGIAAIKGTWLGLGGE